jgi:hypothetical protein
MMQVCISATNHNQNYLKNRRRRIVEEYPIECNLLKNLNQKESFQGALNQYQTILKLDVVEESGRGKITSKNNRLTK